MALLGDGAMVTWHDVLPEGERDYNEWHSREHLAERVGVPGFLRGYRFVARSGRPKYFILYEVEDLAVLTSRPYLDRLNDPTPRTKRILPYLRNNNRTLCRVAASLGSGVMGFVATLQLSPLEGHGDRLRSRLAHDLLPELARKPGVLGAHLLESDQAASRLETEEKRLRATPDNLADWVLLLGGYDPEEIEAALARELSAAALTAHGASDARVSAVYRLHHCLAKPDLHA